MSISEATIQAVLMLWCMNEKHHSFIIPNSNSFLNFSWEADLISVTKAGYSHEYEIKLNIADFRRDAKKFKHHLLGNDHWSPSYFWYATSNFEIIPPTMAGWLNVYYSSSRKWIVDVRKPAPRLNSRKITDRKNMDAARLLSWRLAHIYKKQYLLGDKHGN